MPIIQEHTGQKTHYLKLKSFEFTKNVYSREITVKEPAFTIWNGEEEIYAGQTFGGNFYEINLGEEKEITTKKGIKVKLQDIFLEFRSFDKKGELAKEVIIITYPSTLFEKLIQKLAGVRNFRNLKINVGQYTPKNTNDKKDYLTIFEGKKKLPNLINFKSKNPDFPSPEGLIEIPEIEYLEFEDGSKEVHKNWKLKLKKIYWEEFQKIIARLEEFKENDYKEEFEKNNQSFENEESEEVHLVVEDEAINNF